MTAGTQEGRLARTQDLRLNADAGGRRDGEVLRRYAETRDETAFVELVRRNGPLVLRACRNALRDPTAADDAFQVTFLLLARNAAKLTNSPSLAGWLHTVAVRSARKIRRAEERRRKRERSDRAPPAGGPPCCTPVTSKVLLTSTWTSVPSDLMTWTT